MAPTQVVFGSPTIENHRPRGQQYLLYLWKFVPGLADEHDIIMPDETVKQQFYSGLLSVCQSSEIHGAFNHGYRTYGYPWMFQHDSKEGMYWATVFARAAYAVGFWNIPAGRNDVSSWEKVTEEIHKRVFKGEEEWKPYLGRLFNEARGLSVKYADAVRQDKEDQEKDGPQRLLEEKNVQPF